MSTRFKRVLPGEFHQWLATEARPGRSTAEMGAMPSRMRCQIFGPPRKPRVATWSDYEKRGGVCVNCPSVRVRCLVLNPWVVGNSQSLRQLEGQKTTLNNKQHMDSTACHVLAARPWIDWVDAGQVLNSPSTACTYVLRMYMHRRRIPRMFWTPRTFE